MVVSFIHSKYSQREIVYFVCVCVCVYIYIYIYLCEESVLFVHVLRFRLFLCRISEASQDIANVN
jgi:hypothetical protein